MDERIRKIIDEAQFRPIYAALDVRMLRGIAEDKLEQAIIDYVDAKLTDHGTDEDEVSVLGALPEGIRALYLTWAVESEVINGGFTRYYWSWLGQFAEEAVSAFEFFAAHKHAHLMREANRTRADESVPANMLQDKEAIEAYWSPRLHTLEERFYNLDESLSALRLAKIRSEPQLFCT
jgi:hypothetical protein